MMKNCFCSRGELCVRPYGGGALPSGYADFARLLGRAWKPAPTGRFRRFFLYAFCSPISLNAVSAQTCQKHRNFCNKMHKLL